MRIAIIGCGKIADQHVQAIQRIPGASVVAVCDREPLMAKQLAERFAIPGSYADAGLMLRDISPDVVHITTPPQAHRELAAQCLEAGSHVYVEKPFAVTASETDAMLRRAKQRGLYITTGHNYQFTPEMIRMRELVAAGFLGAAPAHLESYWSYDLGDLSYVGPLLGSREHWVRRLPGQLFHNIVSHGLARLAEFLDSDIAALTATAHQSRQLASFGGGDLLDEMRLTIRDANGVTASFCFSTQIKPGLNRLNVYGTTNSLTVSLTDGTLTKNVGKSYKSYLTFVVPPVNAAIASLRHAAHNAWGIATQRLHYDAGMKELIHRFYRAIETGGPPPIPYREILLTAQIMDLAFAQIARQSPAPSLHAMV